MRPTSMKPTPSVLAALFVSVLTWGWPLASEAAEPRQTGGTQAPSQTVPQMPGTSLDDLRRLIAEQQRQIESQARRLDQLEQALQKTRGEVATVTQQQGVAPATGVEERLAAIEQAVGRQPEMLADMGAEFPGAFRIPGTNSAIRFGGQVRVTGIHTFNALGIDDRFVTSSIPVGPERPPGQESRVVYTAIPSRFSFDVRGPAWSSHTYRTFVEGDFAGSSRAFRLRHAFVQTERFVIGQTWSTFSDPEAEPIGVDFEGLNAISLFRQAQVRYTHRLRDGLRVSIAAENPAPDLTGAEGVNQTPDFIGRLRWEPPKRDAQHGLSAGRVLYRAEHVQASVLARQLRGQVGESSTTVATHGLGVNVSGVVATWWDADDRIKFAANFGSGIGKYITDLGTLGGQDAVYDPDTGTLEALRVDSAYVGYERRWRPTLVSAFTYGIVNVHNLAVQSDDSFRRTQRATFNITWSPVPQAEIGIEFLTGRRKNKDGQSAGANQLQVGWTYRFY